MNIIIVGCSKLGLRLAHILSDTGNGVVVIEPDMSAIERLNDSFSGVVIHGVPMDVSVLENAGIRECNAMAVVTDSDNLNIVVAQIAATKYRVPNVVALVSDPERETVYENTGLKTVCPTKSTASAISNLLLKNAVAPPLPLGVSTAGFEWVPGKHFAGKRVGELTGSACMLFAIVGANDVAELATDKDRVIKEDDRLVIARLVD